MQLEFRPRSQILLLQGPCSFQEALVSLACNNQPWFICTSVCLTSWESFKDKACLAQHVAVLAEQSIEAKGNALPITSNSPSYSLFIGVLSGLVNRFMIIYSLPSSSARPLPSPVSFMVLWPAHHSISCFPFTLKSKTKWPNRLCLDRLYLLPNHNSKLLALPLIASCCWSFSPLFTFIWFFCLKLNLLFWDNCRFTCHCKKPYPSPGSPPWWPFASAAVTYPHEETGFTAFYRLSKALGIFQTQSWEITWSFSH